MRIPKRQDNQPPASLFGHSRLFSSKQERLIFKVLVVIFFILLIGFLGDVAGWWGFLWQPNGDTRGDTSSAASLGVGSQATMGHSEGLFPDKAPLFQSFQQEEAIIAQAGNSGKCKQFIYSDVDAWKICLTDALKEALVREDAVGTVFLVQEGTPVRVLEDSVLTGDAGAAGTYNPKTQRFEWRWVKVEVLAEKYAGRVGWTAVECLKK